MPRKGKELSSDVKKVVWDLLQQGNSIRKVAELLGIPHTTIASVKTRIEQRGSVENAKRSGRPRKLTDRHYRRLERLVKTNRRHSLVDITNRFNESVDQPVAKRTVQFHLHKHGFSRRVSRKKVVVKEVNRKKRLSWCKKKRRLTVENYWKRVIFSDESKIMVGHDSRVYVWRKKDEGLQSDLETPRQHKPCYEVMIWGCVTWEGVGTITAVNGNINAEKYQEILDDNLWPVIVRHFPAENYIFQQDNAPVHRARTTQEFLHRNNVTTMSWPAQSPDLNIIKNLWLLLKRKLQTRVGRIESKDDLFREIQDIWTGITVDYVRSLYRSIPRRLLNVIKLKGHLTKY